MEFAIEANARTCLARIKIEDHEWAVPVESTRNGLRQLSVYCKSWNRLYQVSMTVE